MDTQLSRRDALAALAAGGITATAGCSAIGTDGSADHERSSTETLVELAEVLYPAEIEPTEEFIKTYLFNRIADEESYQEELEAGLETLTELSEDEHGSGFAVLDDDERVTLFEKTDLRSGNSVPDGSAVERLNYHIIDELLFAFYASPTGGELVGNPNPVGFPGSYGNVPAVDQ